MKLWQSSALLLGTALMLASLAFWGCASKPAAAWQMYAKVNYLYGRIEAHAEQHCKAPIPADRVDVCREAKSLQQEIKAINPIVVAELSKEEPDWGRIIQYTDLVLGVAGKFILP